MSILDGPVRPRGGAHDLAQLDPLDLRARRSARRLRLRQALRAATTFLAASAALAALWQNRPPAPDWRSFSGPSTAAWDVIGLVGSALGLAAAATLAYLAAVAGANLIIGITVSTARRSNRPVGRAVMLTRRATPRWLAAAAVSIAAAAASVPSAGATDGRTDPMTVTLEALADTHDAPSAPPARTMLPWATHARIHSAAAAPTSTTTAPTPTTATPTTATPTAATPTAAAPPGAPPPSDAAAPSPELAAPRAHPVARGEHFWVIAERIVAERGHTEPVESYWSRLVAANRENLVDRSNPSLLLTGQIIVIPD